MTQALTVLGMMLALAACYFLPPQEIVLLRFKLWWRFKPFWYTGGYHVSVKKAAIKGFPPFWAYINNIDGVQLEIGPVQQWTMEEAIEIARQQYRNLVAPPKPRVAAEALPAHEMQIRLKEGGCFGLVCTCGWKGNLKTDQGHMCVKGDCQACDVVYLEWEQHAGRTIERLPGVAIDQSGARPHGFRLPGGA